MPVLHRPDLIDIGVNTISYAKGTIEFDQFFCSWRAHGDLCKHLGIYLSTGSDDRYVVKSGQDLG